ncbi:MAG: amidohydrolase, partial [Bacteroidia bacterium]
MIILLIPSLLSAQSETAQCILAERIFTSDTSHPVAEAMVIEGSSIRYIGSADSALTLYPNARVSDYGKAFIYPGFIDAHCHFLGYAQGLNEASLFGSNSIKEAIKATQKQAKKQAKMPIALRPDSWIIGRGWDQNLWGGQFPTRADLDAAFPDVPVCLSRVDGHAVWVNSAAERLLNVDSDFQIDGGESFEGVYIDAAADYIKERIPAMNSQALQQAVKTAEQKAFAVGLTGLHEAGLEVEQTLWLQQLQESGALKIRLNVMLSANEQTFSHLAQFGQWSSERMNVHAVKFYLDGALGSRGALLKEDYCDRLQHRGLQLINIQELCSYAYFL